MARNVPCPPLPSPFYSRRRRRMMQRPIVRTRRRITGESWAFELPPQSFSCSHREARLRRADGTREQSATGSDTRRSGRRPRTQTAASFLCHAGNFSCRDAFRRVFCYDFLVARALGGHWQWGRQLSIMAGVRGNEIEVTPSSEWHVKFSASESFKRGFPQTDPLVNNRSLGNTIPFISDTPT
jgi:hypothetical protein